MTYLTLQWLHLIGSPLLNVVADTVLGWPAFAGVMVLFGLMLARGDFS